MARATILPGTLDLLILRTLLFGPLRGHGIGKHIRQASEDVLQVEHGSLYPALQRLERDGLIKSNWAEDRRGREMKFYRRPQHPRHRSNGLAPSRSTAR